MDPVRNQVQIPHLTASTTVAPRAHGLRLQGPGSMGFQRLGKGLVTHGVAFRAEFNGPKRFEDAQAWWATVSINATVNDSVNRPGSGLVAFATFTFDDQSKETSVMIVPQTVFGIDETGCFETQIHIDAEQSGPIVSTREPNPDCPTKHWTPGLMDEPRFLDLCSLATAHTTARDFHKVVIARDLVRAVPSNFSPHESAQWLAEAYPDTHVFSVDGLFGASPETLASVRDGRVSLRVLAGSAPRGSDPVSDQENAHTLATSSKDLDEHGFAVKNVLDSLSQAGIRAVGDELPFTLKLPNLWHLATDVTGDMPPNISVLDVVRALHPTAAVAGTPTDKALDFIRGHEQLDRGRYAGPVGWMDANGNGDWALALRCAQFDPHRSVITAYAGAGIVNGSDPWSELRETELKFRPILDAVESTAA